MRVARVVVLNVPNPAAATGSFRATASPIVAKMAPTIPSALALVSERSAVKRDENWMVPHHGIDHFQGPCFRDSLPMIRKHPVDTDVQLASNHHPSKTASKLTPRMKP